jgi:hypothetical protein
MLVEAFHQLAGLASDLDDLRLNSNLMCGHIFGVLLDCPPQDHKAYIQLTGHTQLHPESSLRYNHKVFF